MKREDITKVFPEATKEQIDEVLNLNGADIGRAKGDRETLEGELATARSTITQLRETVGKFDGIDAEALKKSVADWEKKYNDDTAQLKLSAAVDRALFASGARNPRLISAAIDKSKLKLDGETLSGLSEQLEALKKSDPYLFAGALTSDKGTGGLSLGGGAPDLSALSDEEYYAAVLKKST